MTSIKRRGFLSGSAVTLGGAMVGLPTLASSERFHASSNPPELTGLRGSHPGSNTYAHALAWSPDIETHPFEPATENYDLVIVGAGLSGLAAAYEYRRAHGTDKTILILDNHDDFGGHARRNEYHVDGKKLITYGGSQTLVEPYAAGLDVMRLFNDIGVVLDRFDSAFDRDFYRRHGLCATTYFSAKRFGKDVVVNHPFTNYYNFIEGLPGQQLSDEEAVSESPLSPSGKAQLLQALKAGDHLIDLPPAQRQQYVSQENYFTYLREVVGIDDEDVLHIARHSVSDWSNAAAELLTVEEARDAGALGFKPVAVYDPENPYIHHYPDGNAGVARSLVKHLIPDVAKGNTAESLVTARFDYGMLDRPESPVKLRLASTVVGVKHNGDPASSDSVAVRYMHGDSARVVTASHVVLACYNVMIPYIVKDLPKEQADALAQQKKSPLIYSTVAMRHWRGFVDRGIGLAMSPGNRHQVAFLDFPVSMGGYAQPQTPDDPCALQMISCPYSEEVGVSRGDQYKEARQRMLSEQLTDYEKDIRGHLTGMLSAKHFNFDRDVAGITVNRWAHGYAVAGPGDSARVGRQPFGRLAIANADSAPAADAIEAMRMGIRAVHELKV